MRWVLLKMDKDDAFGQALIRTLTRFLVIAVFVGIGLGFAFGLMWATVKAAITPIVRW